MKKVALYITLFCVLLFFTGCGESLDHSLFHIKTDEEIADQTMRDVIDGICEKDSSKIVELFAENIADSADFSKEATRFIEFFDGEIISFSVPSRIGITSEKQVENGMTEKYIWAVSTVNTTNGTYHIEIKECTKDERDRKNKGVTVICIINSKDFQENCVYRCNCEKEDGIHIVE